jgi:hypothetical protein
MGSFLPLEIAVEEEYHKAALALNSGRNSLRVLLEGLKIKRLIIPAYICDSVVDAARASGTEVSFYRITDNFMPEKGIKADKDELMLYPNYFGIFHSQASAVARQQNVVIDNVQAFFELPFEGVPAIYSARKYFGVPDGGYLYSNLDAAPLEKDTSAEFCQFLISKADGVQNILCRPSYLENEKRIETMPLKRMSSLTRTLMCGIEYEVVAKKRRENYRYLHQHLSGYNLIDAALPSGAVPLVYPLLLRCEGLRKKLIENGVYVATYWQEVLGRVEKDSFEGRLVSNLVPLPVDQRYDTGDMEKLAALVKKLM